jgi:hypothetical protein
MKRTAARLADDSAGKRLIAHPVNHRIRKVIGIAAPGQVAGQ